MDTSESALMGSERNSKMQVQGGGSARKSCLHLLLHQKPEPQDPAAEVSEGSPFTLLSLEKAGHLPPTLCLL